MKVGSLFSGCGGLDLGFIMAGCQVKWAVDFDKDACSVYEENIGKIINGDILDIKEDSLSDVDIITAGFPCQPFSSAGNRKGVNDHRGNLFFETLRFIKEKKPKAIVFENVRGLLSTKNVTGNNLIDDIVEILQNIDDVVGYNVKWQLLKASDFEVPQNRYRVFIVGIRKDLDKTFQFPAPILVNDISKLTVGSIISKTDNLPNNEHWELSAQAKLMAEHIKEGGSWKDVPYELLPPRFKKIMDNIKFYRNPNFYRRFARTEINGTITASAQPENCGILHPLENRRYTVREIARIQSFPDTFTFTLPKIENAYKVIGNAVPPNLAKHVANALIDQLKTKSRK